MTKDTQKGKYPIKCRTKGLYNICRIVSEGRLLRVLLLDSKDRKFRTKLNFKIPV